MRSICFLVIAGSLETRIDELKWKFTLVMTKHSCINFCYLSCLSSYLKPLNEAKEVFVTSPDTCPDMTKAENLEQKLSFVQVRFSAFANGQC